MIHIFYKFLSCLDKFGGSKKLQGRLGGFTGILLASLYFILPHLDSQEKANLGIIMASTQEDVLRILRTVLDLKKPEINFSVKPAEARKWGEGSFYGFYSQASGNNLQHVEDTIKKTAFFLELFLEYSYLCRVTNQEYAPNDPINFSCFYSRGIVMHDNFADHLVKNSFSPYSDFFNDLLYDKEKGFYYRSNTFNLGSLVVSDK